MITIKQESFILGSDVLFRYRRKINIFCISQGTSVQFTVFFLTNRLQARDFYEVIVDEAEIRINCHLVEIESG